MLEDYKNALKSGQRAYRACVGAASRRILRCWTIFWSM